tara:strand:+ start:205417 stop:206343 length:927 start_codon:yes stop_codon:yes gene_type:complete
MIYVSQGHEKGIGLEVFLKAFLCFDSAFQENFKLFTFKSSLENVLKSCSLDYIISEDNLSFYNTNLKLELLEDDSEPQSSIALKSILNIINSKDHLVTLPTSKDQLIYNRELVNGHTEYFRSHFKNQSISMNFISPDFNCLLLTDHIAISKIEETLTKEYILNKVRVTLNQIQSFKNVDEVVFSGINPHNGENGLISNTDEVLNECIKELKSEFPKLTFTGPYPADTIHMQGISANKLFIYASHDQGLAPYKLYNGLIGINLCLGLPFLRTSVDHGTAFNLYGKNSANYLGMLYLLKSLRESQKKAQN